MVPVHQGPPAVCPQVSLQEPQISQESQPQRQQQPQPFPLQVRFESEGVLGPLICTVGGLNTLVLLRADEEQLCQTCGQEV